MTDANGHAPFTPIGLNSKTTPVEQPKDIVERLRAFDWRACYELPGGASNTMAEAADEIVRLRAERGHVTHNAEIGLTEIVARDCPHYASAEVVQATVLRDMTSREIVGVQFATLKEPRND